MAKASFYWASQGRRQAATLAVEDTDHRTRVGRERRERTQARIIEAALRVFAEKGPDAPIIDDFIKAAGVARGTFYNYYQSTEELLEATAKWLQDDLIVSIEAEIGSLGDPVERLSSGIQLWLRKARTDAAWCAFSVRVRRHGGLVEQQLGADLKAGREAGVLTFIGVEAARDLVVGALREAMFRMTEGRVSATYPRDITRLILLGLGLDARSADEVLGRPLPRLRRAARTLA